MTLLQHPISKIKKALTGAIQYLHCVPCHKSPTDTIQHNSSNYLHRSAEKIAKYEKKETGLCAATLHLMDSLHFAPLPCYRNPSFPSPPILSLAEPQYSGLVAPGGFQDTGGGIISPASAFARINTKPRKNISEDLKWALAMLILHPISRRQSPPKILRFKTMFYI